VPISTHPRPKWPVAGAHIVGRAQPEPRGGERSEGAGSLSWTVSKTAAPESQFIAPR
jgi:hypothetical protein